MELQAFRALQAFKEKGVLMGLLASRGCKEKEVFRVIQVSKATLEFKASRVQPV